MNFQNFARLSSNDPVFISSLCPSLRPLFSICFCLPTLLMPYITFSLDFQFTKCADKSFVLEMFKNGFIFFFFYLASMYHVKGHD